ncbi:DNA/RNA helicase domain-containing protein [Marilutibacter maris]|uniref:Peptidase S24/S26A/S26B, conserved region n=1 Tax=Marilutibacter maris TaxID=1605891 RepID=A0A2U9TAU4_9GAMM|nr:DNA/RNA helicase domain-containing protein [Lysobacter maris]AWV07668.1 Peptidase S24/S26A/S26B, conserved region [Lysobacter maris]
MKAFLYSGTTPDFIRDTTQNAIAKRLAEAFEAHFRYKPSPAEFQSWQNSLRCFSDVLREGDLMSQGIFLEYQLPLSSKRIDAMVTGRGGSRDRAIIVELKQWTACEHGSGEDLLKTWVGGSRRDVLHPSVQANQYRRYLEDMHGAFQGDDDRVLLEACAYLHNYTPKVDDPLLDERSSAVRKLAPVFTSGEMSGLARHISERLGQGDGERVLSRIAESRYRPAKKLLANVSKVINEEPEFVLLDEQQVVFSQIVATVKSALKDTRKHVFLVHGGPGTGKSVLALNLLGALSGKGYNAQHATGSKAFTATLQKIVGREASRQFRYFNNFGQAQPNDVDVLLCDEAHRIRATSNHRFTRKELWSDRPQIQEIMDAARVSVFFVDDQQIVRPNEIGSSSLIREAAATNGYVLHERWLETQFRCAGSEGFVNWVDNTLGIRRTANVLFDQSQESFEFGIVDSPEALDELIREKSREGHSARLVAGYCWPWSKKLDADGSLMADVRIGTFERPWNARPDMTGLPRGVPKADYWAYDPTGIDQVGCIYTAQGFEFDYVGVIWGRDLRYQSGDGWCGDRMVSQDTTVKRSKDRFLELVKNTYRVLLSRGMKGCYVYFEDSETEKFFRSRTENLESEPAVLPSLEIGGRASLPVQPLDARPFQVIRQREVRPWENAVPLLDLKVAAGDFSDAQLLEQEAVEWVSLPDHIRIAPGYFVARVSGESMNRRVPNGSWVLFSSDMRGTKQGRMVLAERHALGDPEHSGRYTLKIYDAQKLETDDGPEYQQILLRPESSDPSYRPFELNLDDDERPAIVAWVVTVLV